ncbi:MAG: DNA polymerase III subunit gamma/tau [Acidimicrobiales bacterium]
MAEDQEAPYQALYRRFRPQRFSDVVGQEHVTRVLRSAVRDSKVAHAYLFSGPRGTGKTSTARILAMALNCETPADGEPCGQCRSCLAVRSGSSLDVQELDSATNRGIDEMRDLLSRVALGSPGRWKVYIVDEVHQITPAAAGALLKTLEEPPAHVIFVLATTDPQKVLDTIRSRTQHFEFHLLGPDVLAALVADVAGRAGVDLEPEALDVVVRRGHGSARDALSVLDQVAAAGGVESDTVQVGDVVAAIAEQDPGGALVKLAEAIQSGYDARRLGSEIVEYLRNGFLATRAPSLVQLAPGELAQVAAHARSLGAAGVVRAMELIGAALIDMRDSPEPRITLEVALVRLCAADLDDSRAAILERLERLESLVSKPSSGVDSHAGRLESTSNSPASAGRDPDAPARPRVTPPPPPLPKAGGARPRPGSPAVTPASPAVTDPSPTVVPANPAVAPPANPPVTEVTAKPENPGSAQDRGEVPTREELTLAWGDKILPSLRPAVKVYVATGRFLPSANGRAVLAVPDRGLLTRAQANKVELEKVLSSHFGRRVGLDLVVDPASASTQPGRSGSGVAGEPRDEEVEDFDIDELDDAPSALASPAQRLLEAFPGAEEVQP